MQRFSSEVYYTAQMLNAITQLEVLISTYQLEPIPFDGIL